MKKIDHYFRYVMRESRAGELTYIHSAPCLDINAPMQDFWIRKARGESILELGNGMWAATQGKGN